MTEKMTYRGKTVAKKRRVAGLPWAYDVDAGEAAEINKELRRHMTPEQLALADAPPPVIAPSRARVGVTRAMAKEHGLVLRKVRGFKDAFELIHDATDTLVLGDNGTGEHKTLDEVQAYLREVEAAGEEPRQIDVTVDVAEEEEPKPIDVTVTVEEAGELNYPKAELTRVPISPREQARLDALHEENASMQPYTDQPVESDDEE